MKYARALRRLRRERGLTQNQIAIATGIAGQFISHFENGRRKPWPKAVKQLSDFFGVDIENLVESREAKD